MLTFATSTEAFEKLLETVYQEGVPAPPRGEETRELLAVSFKIENIRARLISSPERGWSLPLALGEFCWHCTGNNRVAALSYYSKAWKRFSSDKTTIVGSCYGRRLFMSQDQRPSQWEQNKEELRRDPYSRRALLMVGGPLDEWGADPVDVPCVVSMQFLLRNGRLNMVVTMRSNDIIWGLGYDVFLFTMFQERMALELDVEPGWYFHTTASLHLYKRHFALAERVLEARTGNSANRGLMPSMCSVEQIGLFCKCEQALREGSPDGFEMPSDQYWRNLVDVLVKFSATKGKSAEMLPADQGARAALPEAPS